MMWLILFGKTGAHGFNVLEMLISLQELVYPIEQTKPYLRGDEFDAIKTVQFRFHHARFFVQDSTQFERNGFRSKTKELRDAFGEDSI